MSDDLANEAHLHPRQPDTAISGHSPRVDTPLAARAGQSALITDHLQESICAIQTMEDSDILIEENLDELERQ